MGRHWVYRRPFVRFSRRKPLPAPAVGSPVVARAARRALRVRRRIRRRVHHVGGSFTGRTAAQPRRIVRQRRRILRRAFRAKPPGSVFTPTFGGVFPRIHKAIQRMRRAMQVRLRWRKREEIPPITVPVSTVHANPRGSVFAAGAEEGCVYSSGAKRGRVF